MVLPFGPIQNYEEITGLELGRVFLFCDLEAHAVALRGPHLTPHPAHSSILSYVQPNYEERPRRVYVISFYKFSFSLYSKIVYQMVMVQVWAVGIYRIVLLLLLRLCEETSTV